MYVNVTSLFDLASAAWNRDWKPGSFPETTEEKSAAAEKYGLRPKDYRPYDPDRGG